MQIEATLFVGGKKVMISCHLHMGAWPLGLCLVRIAPLLDNPCAMSFATEGFSAITSTRGRVGSIVLDPTGRNICFSIAGRREEEGARGFVNRGGVGLGLGCFF